jgi:hypothetical protein
MRYLSMFKAIERDTPPTEQEMAAMGAYIEQEARAGNLIAAEGCLPSAFGVRVRATNGKYSVTDGPFTEAKEIIGGFAIINATSKEDAIEQAKRFLAVAGTDGECEVRQLYEVPAAVAQ